MDSLAMWIGYFVMAAGGVGVSAAAMAFAGYVLVSRWKDYVNLKDLGEAISEWRKAHPERAKEWKKRNGINEI